MNRLKIHSAEDRERTVHMEMEQQDDHDSQWGAIQSSGGKIGCANQTY